MEHSKAIILPKISSLKPTAIDYKTGQKGEIPMQKAKDVVFAAILNGDLVHIVKDNMMMTAIGIVDVEEVNRESAKIKVVPK